MKRKKNRQFKELTFLKIVTKNRGYYASILRTRRFRFLLLRY